MRFCPRVIQPCMRARACRIPTAAALAAVPPSLPRGPPWQGPPSVIPIASRFVSIPARQYVRNELSRLVGSCRACDRLGHPSYENQEGRFAEVLTAIYNARSAYLHAGEPMYLSIPIKGGEQWDTDPTFGMTIDNREFSADQKLPYAYFLDGLVRHCLLNYLKFNVHPRQA